MKHTIAGLIVLVLSGLFPIVAYAVTIPNIRLKATATPTAKLILNQNLKQILLIPSSTPIPTKDLQPTVTFAVTKVPTPTIEATITETSVPTLQPTESPSPTAGLTVINDGDSDNLTIWFLAATIGLLLVIVVAQAWPRKDDKDDQS